MKLYLAGPMTGYPNDNVPAFAEMGARLRAAGYEVVIPCEGHEETQHTRTWEEWLALDFALVLGCDGIATLDGWTNSAGATREATLALTLGRPLYSASALLECAPTDASPALLVGGPPSRSTALEPARRMLLDWSRRQFPARQAEPTLAHLEREWRELIQADRDPLEMADVQMLLWAWADCAGVDLAAAVHEKLEIVKRRTWGAPDASGVVEHVRRATQAVA
jgi:hypothetical protein